MTISLKNLYTSPFLACKGYWSKKRNEMLLHILNTANFILDMRIPTISFVGQIIDPTTADSGAYPLQNFSVVCPKFNLKFKTNFATSFHGLVFSNTDRETPFAIYKTDNVLRVQFSLWIRSFPNGTCNFALRRPSFSDEFRLVLRTLLTSRITFNVITHIIPRG